MTVSSNALYGSTRAACACFIVSFGFERDDPPQPDAATAMDSATASANRKLLNVLKPPSRCEESDTLSVLTRTRDGDRKD